MSKLSFKTFVKKSFPTVFAKTYFYGFWKVVYNFCLKGMGIGNGITLYTSGEKAVIKHIFKKYNIKTVFDSIISIKKHKMHLCKIQGR